MGKYENSSRSYFSNKIKELREKEDLTATKIEKALGLSAGSWSRYERSLVRPNLSVAHKIADFFGVSLDELAGRDGDKGHITLIRSKHAKERLGPEEFEKAWLLGKKVFELVSTDDHSMRKKYMKIIDTITNLLDETDKGRDKKSTGSPFPGEEP
jgi:transcriptional regulator with XRE-family HTH domain